jgi:outer membrane protein TolC
MMRTNLTMNFVAAAFFILLIAGQEDVAAQTSAAPVAIPPIVSETITLQDAIKRAQGSDPAYASAATDRTIAGAQTGIARSALLPGVVYHNQFLYTQPQHVGGKPVATGASSPIFIANNAVHEYISQASVTETISPSLLVDYRKANADAAAASARLEVARRGLVSTVVTNYYAVLVADEKVSAQRRALDEATHFQKISSQLEAGGEVAHADVIKANIEMQQKQRDLDDALLAAERARLDLAVLLFSNPLTTYKLEGDLHAPKELPLREQINAAANAGNPDLKAALASFHSARLELTSSRFDYIPSLSLNYSYGIDAPQFAVNGPDGARNLGYSFTAGLDIPVWDWFATHNKIKQSAAKRDLAKVQLTYTQRQLEASIEELYREAEVARVQMASLDVSVRDATEALRLADLRYTNGEAPILEVVDAQNTLISIQNSRAEGAARYSTALAQLQTLTGNLP